MKQNHLAALLIFGSFALIACVPATGILILSLARPPSDPLVAYYLLFATPLGMLGWAIIRKNQWDQSESKALQVCSRVNTVVLYLDIIALCGFVIYGCFFADINPFAPAYSR